MLVMLAIPAILTQCSSSHPENEPIPNDPKVLHDFLDNGLEYFVRENSKPQHRVELRLVIKAGALAEDENQSGVAHLLEHMLFNGTEKYSGQALKRQLKAFGIDYGAGIHAYTSPDRSIYQLSLGSDNLDIGLDILNQWAFHAELDPESLKKEILVVREEWRLSENAETRKYDALRALYFHGTAYVKHHPLGSMDLLMNASVSDLQRFYKEWYRPELMAVIAVGDFDADEIVRKIQELFGKAVNPPDTRPLPVAAVPSHDDLLRDIFLDPGLDETWIEIGTIFPRPVLTDLASHKTRLIYRLLSDMMIERLYQLNFDSFFFNTYDLSKPIAVAALVGKTDDVPKGMETLLLEAEQIRQHGFLPSELDNVKIWFWEDFREYWELRDNQRSETLAETYIDACTFGEAWPSIDWRWKTVNNLLNDISLEDLNQAAQTLFGSTNRYVFVSGPSRSRWSDFDEGDIPELMADVRSRKLPPRNDLPASDDYRTALPAKNPEPGSIVRREVMPETGIVILTLSNGARVYYKVRNTMPNELYFGAASPGGTNMLDDNMLFAEDLSLHSYNKNPIELLMANTGVNASVHLKANTEGMYGTGRGDEMEAVFHYLYMQHSAKPASREDWNNAKINLIKEADSRNSSPATMFRISGMQEMKGNPYRGQPVSSDILARCTLDDAYTVYRDRFAQAGDFIYLFTGDFDPDELERLASVWLASFPSPSEPETWKDRKIRYLQKPIEYTAQNETDPISHIWLAWAGDWDGSQNQYNLIKILVKALEKKLYDSIREEYGGAYRIDVYSIIEYVPIPQYRINISFQCDPERAGELLSKLKGIVEGWKTNPPETRYLHETIAMLSHEYQESKNENYWWIDHIEKMALYGIPFPDLSEWKQNFEAVTPELLKKTAVRYLDGNRMFTGLLMPEN